MSIPFFKGITTCHFLDGFAISSLPGWFCHLVKEPSLAFVLVLSGISFSPLGFRLQSFFHLVMSSSSSSLERAIDEYQDVSSRSGGSYENGEGNTSTSGSSSNEHYSSRIPSIPIEEFQEM